MPNSTNNNTNLYPAIKTWIEQAEDPAFKNLKFARIEAYWQIGKLLHAEVQLLPDQLRPLAQQLTIDFNKKYKAALLRKMMVFYTAYPVFEKLRGLLTWSHYKILLKIDYAPARYFYTDEAARHYWSVAQLQRQLKALYFERLVEQQKQQAGQELTKLLSPQHWQPEIWLKELYILEFLEMANQQDFLERDLEDALLEKLQHFILELGQGFAFVSRQQRLVTATGKTFYMDLVFYHYIKKCFVILELKVGKLSHRDIGQMDMYVRLADEKWRGLEDNPTVGIILCSEKDHSLLRYSVLHDSHQVFAAKYQLKVPQLDELEDKVQRLLKRLMKK